MRAGALGRVHGEALMIIQRKQRSLSQFECFVNKRLPPQVGRASVLASPVCRRGMGSRGHSPSWGQAFSRQHPNDNLHVVLAKAVEAQSLAGGMALPVGPDLGIAVAGCPFAYVRVETLAVPDHRRQQHQVAALAQLPLQTPAQFVAGLRLDRHPALRAELCAQPRKEQADEVMNLRDRGHRAFAPAAADALLNTHRGRDAGDQVHVGPRQLLHKLSRVDVH